MTMKLKNTRDVVRELRTRCSCGCGAQVLVQIADDEVMLDTRLDGRLVTLLASHSPGI